MNRNVFWELKAQIQFLASHSCTHTQRDLRLTTSAIKAKPSMQNDGVTLRARGGGFICWTSCWVAAKDKEKRIELKFTNGAVPHDTLLLQGPQGAHRRGRFTAGWLLRNEPQEASQRSARGISTVIKTPVFRGERRLNSLGGSSHASLQHSRNFKFHLESYKRREKSDDWSFCLTMRASGSFAETSFEEMSQEISLQTHCMQNSYLI